MEIHDLIPVLQPDTNVNDDTPVVECILTSLGRKMPPRIWFGYKALVKNIATSTRDRTDDKTWLREQLVPRYPGAPLLHSHLMLIVSVENSKDDKIAGIDLEKLHKIDNTVSEDVTLGYIDLMKRYSAAHNVRVEEARNQVFRFCEVKFKMPERSQQEINAVNDICRSIDALELEKDEMEVGN